MRNNFIFLVFCSIFLAFFSKKILEIDNLVIESLSQNFSIIQIDKILDFRNKWEWITYILIPLFLLIKVVMICFLLDIGCYFFSNKLKFYRLFNIVIKSEFIFLFVIIVKTTWFYFIQTAYTLEDLKNYYPLSAINITGYKSLDIWWVYPLQTLNLFEIAYWLVLAYLLGKELNISTDKGLAIVASSYGVGLLIWVVGIMFLTLNMS